jgi:multicopper oxidase
MLWLRSFRKECTLFILPRLDVPTFSYELRIARSTSGDQHPMHLHRHTFEISRPGKKEMNGLFKDVVECHAA